jgi:hypothetical protein
MASMRKLQQASEAAYDRYVTACADAVSLGLEVAATGISRNEEPAELAKLRRRAGAYRAEWTAAERRLEVAVLSREVSR